MNSCASGFQGCRRYSLSRIFICSCHCAQACFETVSNIFCPKGLSKGGSSRPSSCWFSFTHWTILAIGIQCNGCTPEVSRFWSLLLAFSFDRLFGRSADPLFFQIGHTEQ